MTREEAVKVMQLNIAECEDTLCYSENKGIREQKEAFEIALEALQPWVRTADRAPTMEDADAWDLVFATHRAFGGEPYKVCYQVVANNPSDHVWWMPIPPLPDHIADAGKKEADHA